MPDIYDQHKAAFANVSAYVVLKDGDRVATIAFKFPRDGAGRLYAYVHFIGSQMTRGFAAGGGYDKRSAAVADAISKAKFGDTKDHDSLSDFRAALITDDGDYWNHRLERAGFTVWQAV